MTAESQPVTRYGPDYRDLYLIIIGLVVGILLGPGVLGRIDPDRYDAWFVGSADINAQLASLHQQAAINLQDKIDRLNQSGVTDVHVSEIQQQLQAEIEQQRIVLQAARDHAIRQKLDMLHVRVMALIFVIVAVMVIETVVNPAALLVRQRLSYVRYALIAIVLAIVLAQPALARQIPWPFVALVLIISLLAAFVPFNRRPPINA